MAEFIRTISITRRIEWDSAHRVLRHESKCGTLHGHRYVALITCTASELDDCDRVLDFGVLKERVGEWVDMHWDHTTLVNSQDEALAAFCADEFESHGKRAPYIFDAEPTAETIASELLAVSQQLLADTDVLIQCVEVFETPNCSAKVYAP
jgi:6-pyruvoyltetrahydropterin/6-carboxytetrahydropterin synthase